MSTHSWDGECGKKHYRTELVADTVKFLGGKDGDSNVTTQRAEPTGDVAADDDASLPF